jgi:hypothetical protein
MNLMNRWRAAFWKRDLPAASGVDSVCAAGAVNGLDKLEARLSQWSRLWSHETGPQESESALHAAEQQLVAERLARWMDRCFGKHVQTSLHSKDRDISLASSTPIFTAFLGRRATRELSRRVLEDI